MKRGVTSALALASLLALSDAHAQPREAAGGSAPSEALDLFRKSMIAYREGRFQEAVDLLQRAYAREPEPVLLYNLARAYEGLGDDDKALDAYERYLREEPHAPDAMAIKKRMETLRARIAEREALKKQREERRLAESSAAEKVDVDRRAPGKNASPVPWIVAGVGALGAGAGGVFAFLASSAHDDASANPDADGAQADRRVWRSLQTAKWVSFIAGGVVGGAGIVWGIVDVASSGGREARGTGVPSLMVRLGPTNLIVGGTF